MSTEPDDRLEFLIMVAKVIEGVEGVSEVSINREQMAVAIRRDGFEDVFLAVGPLYHQLDDVPPEKHGEAIAHAIVQGLRQMEPLPRDPEALIPLSDLPPWEETAPKLYPVLGPPFFHGSADLALLRVPFLPLVHAYIAYDEVDSFRLLSAPDAGRLGKTTNAILAASLDNLAKLQHRFEPIDEELPFPNFRLTTDDAYASSRLAVTGLLPMMMEHTKGPAVAAIPDRGTLLITGADEVSLTFLLETTEQLWLEGEHKVSPMLYCVDKAGVLSPLEVGPEHPLADGLARVRALFLVHVYEEQGKALRALAEQQEEDVAITEATAIEHPELGIVTVTPLARGGAALLPVTDLVFLSWSETDTLHHMMLRRDVLLEHAPQTLVELEDHEPMRLLVASFPSAAELEALRPHAVSTGSRPLADVAADAGAGEADADADGDADAEGGDDDEGGPNGGASTGTSK